MDSDLGIPCSEMSLVRRYTCKTTGYFTTLTSSPAALRSSCCRTKQQTVVDLKKLKGPPAGRKLGYISGEERKLHHILSTGRATKRGDHLPVSTSVHQYDNDAVVSVYGSNNQTGNCCFVKWINFTSHVRWPLFFWLLVKKISQQLAYFNDVWMVDGAYFVPCLMNWDIASYWCKNGKASPRVYGRDGSFLGLYLATLPWGSWTCRTTFDSNRSSG